MMKDSLIKIIQPYVARVISSTRLLNIKRQLLEQKRRILGQPHQLTLYLRINDPYSYLLVQVLADFQQRFIVQMGFKTILLLQDDMYPEVEMWHGNGFIDACHLAKLYNLKMPGEAPEESIKRTRQGSECLLKLEPLSLKQGHDWQQVNEVFDQYWFQQPFTQVETQLDKAVLESQLRRNEKVLAEQGHYMSAMVHYAGEWYWGLDRLDHLERRLNALAANSQQPTEVVFDKTYASFCQRPKIVHCQADKKLVLYFSIRSPYSHIALQQAIKLAQHYQLRLEIKPILPMIMRGLSVPKTKKMYIFHDTKREAQKLGLDYGFVADPLGLGVERCYLLFSYAQSLGLEQEFLLNYSLGVNAEGIRSETDRGLKIIVQRSGLDWPQAQTILQDENADKLWRQWAEDNHQQMLALGSWGVPTFQYGDLVLWGQDRIGIIEQAIRKDLNNTK